MDAKLLGTKPGDIVEFDEELPAERFGEELAGPRVVPGPGQGCEGAAPARARRRVRLHRLGVRHDRPSSATTCARSSPRSKEREADGVVRDRALQAMVDTVDVDLPESLIEDETEPPGPARGGAGRPVRHHAGPDARIAGLGSERVSPRTAGTTPCARSRPTSCWKALHGRKSWRSRPRSWARDRADGPGV